MSRQLDSDGSSAEFFCRIPSLPDFDRTFSIEHTKQHAEVAVIPDFNTSAEPESQLPMLFPKTGRNLPFLEGNRLEAIRRPSEPHQGRFSLHNHHGLSIRNPRDFYSHDSSSRELLDATRQRELVPTRPTPIYPRGQIVTDAKKTAARSRRPVCYHETPSRTSMESSSSPPCEVTPYIHSNADDSPNGFQIQNNLFIPIREADNDFLTKPQKEQPLLPRTRLLAESTATPPPRLTLRPRGQQTSLALADCFL
ncbi:unnamed protein product [Cylindrotheca closterium]|uniref:Uncharacterized protein n=1 Tax=Cylindrotheca closterium TaxID=2856 RepID=A0AAD2JKQ1_9STRA|nr:unnamed protein product [Cylindrotheca closterium]